MKIWNWVGVGLICVLASVVLFVVWSPRNADAATTSTFTGSPDALARASARAQPGTPTPTVPPAPPLAAPAVVSTAVPAAPDHVARGQAALSRIPFDLGSVGYTISFHPGSDSHLGLTFTRTRHIEIYVRPSMSDAGIAYVIGHEMGHAVDHILNTGADRVQWAQARGIDANGPWWPVAGGTDLGSPAGDFAECFASWTTGSISQSAWGNCGPALGLMAQLARQ